MNKPAYSLVFAFIIMTVVMLIASTAIGDTRAKLQLFRELEASSQARLAGESSAELGIMALKSGLFSAGETTDEAFCIASSAETGETCLSYGNYTIYPYASVNEVSGNEYFYLPIPGTGDSAPSDSCSISSHKDPDHSCNWNKIMPGQSVSIPLYYEDGETGETGETGEKLFPVDLDLTGWYLRMRTPCENGSLEENCDSGERYEVSDIGAGNYLKIGDSASYNASLILWELIGNTESDGNIYMLPDDAKDSFDYNIRSRVANTEVYEGFLQYDPYGSYYAISDLALPMSNRFSSFTGYQSLFDFILQEDFTNLHFNMTPISAFETPSGDRIPYLEYQVVMDSDLPTMSSRAHVKGEGFMRVGSKTFYFPYTLSTSNTDNFTTLYTLSN